MNTFKKISIGILICSTFVSVTAQQDPMYTHYMFNTLSVNPAYAGSRDALTITALHRSQWVNQPGAPLTQTVNLHTPVSNRNIGIGFSAMKDKIGPVNNTMFAGDFAYIFQLTKKSKLAFGIRAGMHIFQANLNELLLDQQVDPTFTNNVVNRVTPIVGAGFYYSRKRFYAGFSSPNLVENNYSRLTSVDGTPLNGRMKRHYFFITGALFELSKTMDFKPTILVKASSAAPIQTDLTATFIFKNTLHFGGMVRLGDAFGGLIGLSIFQNLFLGYSYDWSLGNGNVNFSRWSHELVLRYDFLNSSNKQIQSPRYF